jgi:hypothetical protein
MKASDANKILIFGAGTSAAEGAPLQSGLFRKYAELTQRNPHRNNYPSGADHL